MQYEHSDPIVEALLRRVEKLEKELADLKAKPPVTNNYYNYSYPYNYGYYPIQYPQYQNQAVAYGTVG